MSVASKKKTEEKKRIKRQRKQTYLRQNPKWADNRFEVEDIDESEPEQGRDASSEGQ